MVLPGTSGTPETMTRPGSPHACASTAWRTLRESLEGIVTQLALPLPHAECHAEAEAHVLIVFHRLERRSPGMLESKIAHAELHAGIGLIGKSCVRQYRDSVGVHRSRILARLGTRLMRGDGRLHQLRLRLRVDVLVRDLGSADQDFGVRNPAAIL